MQRFNITAHLHRYVGRDRHRTVIWKRPYARVETAVSRCSSWMIAEGKVGDVIECVLNRNGDQVVVIHMTLKGKMEINWNRDEAKRLRNAAIMAGLKI